MDEPERRITALEVEYLEDLLLEFGVDGHPDAAEASRIVWDRYQAIKAGYENTASVLVHHVSDGHIGLGGILLPFTNEVHSYLYRDILKNAGEYREPTDRHGGIVRFVTLRHGKTEHSFTGASPANIPHEMRRVYGILDKEGDPIELSAEFYVELSAVHPFYDANGRLDRLVVSIYLYSNGLYMNWDQIDAAHGQFISKINGCLDRRGQEIFSKYFDYFTGFWKKRIVPVEAFHNPNISGEGDETDEE